MSRIDEIKNRIAAAEKGGINSPEWRELEVEVWRDTTFLLSKLEQAEKELQWVYEREGWVRVGNVLESIRD